MSGQDASIQLNIKALLQSDAAGDDLKTYFENLPDHQVRRAIFILARIYPSKPTIANDDLVFIIHMLSSKKYREQESFPMFISSLNAVDFTENQKKSLIDVVTKHIHALCEACTFELDSFLMKIYEPFDLFEYLKLLATDGNIAILQHIFDILQYEDFSHSAVSIQVLNRLKQEVRQTLSLSI